MNQTPTRPWIKHATMRLRSVRERGVVAIIVGLAAFALVGAGGLALDLSRLYVNKTELQTALDACALAASRELVCPTGVGCLDEATQSGLAAAARNGINFQEAAVALDATNVRFSTSYMPHNTYYPAATAPTGSTLSYRYVMCTASSPGVARTLMSVFGADTDTVGAFAVATLGPGAAICPGVPIGVCPGTRGISSTYPQGYAPGDWVAASHNDTSGADLRPPTGTEGWPAGAIRGTFRWIDWDPPAAGTNELRDRLAGSPFCGVGTGSTTVTEAGVKQGAKNAFNSRFGLYRDNNNNNNTSGYNATNASPDRTGWSYPTTAGTGGGNGNGNGNGGNGNGNGNGNGGGNAAVGATVTLGQSAFNDYMTHYNARDPYQGRGNAAGYYDPQSWSGGNTRPVGDASTRDTHTQYGESRRLVTLPLVTCPSTGNTTTLTGRFGCFLLLNPLAQGHSSYIFMEYRGDAGALGSPCPSAGRVGGFGSGGSSGPGTSNAGLVPMLVQ